MADSPRRQEIVNSNITNSQVRLEQQNITNNYIQQLPPTEKQWPRRQRLLLEKMQNDIKLRLAYIDNREVLIPLTVTEQPEAVSGPELKLKQQLKTMEGETEITSQQMIDIFLLPEVGRKLLILGNPGAGKTTTLLQLADELVAQALDAPGSSIPIIFELSTWKDDRQSVWDWMKAQLKEMFNVQPEESEVWLKDELLLPLLDGLDELGMEKQVKCVQALNQFMNNKAYRHSVVCCRVEEYHMARKLLGVGLTELHGAIKIELLDDQQIERYLSNIRQERLWKTVSQERDKNRCISENRSNFLRTPLLLNLVTISCRNKEFVTKGELFEAYLKKQLSFSTRQIERQSKYGLQKEWAHKNIDDEPRLSQVIAYLSWLASKLAENNAPEFYLGKLTTSFLSGKHEQNMYRRILLILINSTAQLSFSSISLSLFVLFSLSSGELTMHELWNIFTKVILFGFLFGLFSLPISINVSLEIYEKNMPDNYGFRFKEACQEIAKSLRTGFFYTVFSAMFMILFVYVISSIPFIEMSEELSVFEAFFLISFLGGFIGFLMGFYPDLNRKRMHIEQIDSPNQVFVRLFSSMLVYALFSYVLGVALFFVGNLIPGLLELVESGTPFLVGKALVSSLLLAVSFPFVTILLMDDSVRLIQHFCLRIVLIRRGHIPLQYVRFLNYCVERRLLQRIGGRYRFIHRELQDYFAAQYRP